MKKTYLQSLKLNAVCFLVISAICFLSPKNVLARRTAADKFQQAIVNGTIVDAANGKPLPGATIAVKGSVVSTSSDANGSFSIGVNTHCWSLKSTRIPWAKPWLLTHLL